MKTQRALIFFTLAALAIWAGYWFNANFEKVPVEVWTPHSGEARYNKLLAASRLLSSIGAPVRSFAGLKELPPLDGTLFVPVSRAKIGPKRSQELLDWVKSGGHLIVVAGAQSKQPKTDLLLDPLGVRRFENTTKAKPQAVVVDIAGSENFLEVEFDPRYRLEHGGKEPVSVIADEHGNHLIALAIGKGMLTVLSDFEFMQNQHIGQYDHAAFFWYLAHYQREGEVWLIYGDEMPSLLQWLAEHAFMVLLSAAALLAAFLWSAACRFGPLLPEPPAQRRRLLEHIEASGRFMWKHGQAADLLASMRESLTRSITFRHPGWASSGELDQRLAQASGLSADQVRSALQYSDISNQGAFTRAIRTLETIRKKL